MTQLRQSSNFVFRRTATAFNFVLSLSLLTSWGLHGCTRQAEQYMDNEKLGLLVRRELPEAEGKPGFWSSRASKYPLFVISDQDHDRMRIMIPLLKNSASEEGTLKTLLEANFDRTMDARYALHDSMLYVTYVHPLHSLSEEEFLAALKQVKSLADNTGASYTSGDMVFGQAKPGK